MNPEQCGAPTRQGTPCRWPYRDCDHEPHREWRRARGLPVSQPGERRPRAVPPPEILRARDLRGLAWWLAEASLTGGIEARDAAVVTSLLRVLASLGPTPMDEEEALREIELRALIAQGIPPRTPEEWARAEALFDDEALAEIRRWPPEGEPPASPRSA